MRTVAALFAQPKLVCVPWTLSRKLAQPDGDVSNRRRLVGLRARRSARLPRKLLSLLRSLKFEDISLNSVLGIEAPTTHELPCLQGYDPVLALTKPVVAPGENRN